MNVAANLTGTRHTSQELLSVVFGSPTGDGGGFGPWRCGSSRRALTGAGPAAFGGRLFFS